MRSFLARLLSKVTSLQTSWRHEPCRMKLYREASVLGEGAGIMSSYHRRVTSRMTNFKRSFLRISVITSPLCTVLIEHDQKRSVRHWYRGRTGLTFSFRSLTKLRGFLGPS